MINIIVYCSHIAEIYKKILDSKFEEVNRLTFNNS